MQGQNFDGAGMVRGRGQYLRGWGGDGDKLMGMVRGWG